MSNQMVFHRHFESRLNGVFEPDCDDPELDLPQQRGLPRRKRRSLSVKFRLPGDDEPDEHVAHPLAHHRLFGSDLTRSSSSQHSPSPPPLHPCESRHSIVGLHGTSRSQRQSVPSPSCSTHSHKSESQSQSLRSRAGLSSSATVSQESTEAPWKVLQERLASLGPLAYETTPKTPTEMNDHFVRREKAWVDCERSPSATKLSHSDQRQESRVSGPAPLRGPTGHTADSGAREADEMWMKYYQQYCLWYQQTYGRQDVVVTPPKTTEAPHPPLSTNTQYQRKPTGVEADRGGNEPNLRTILSELRDVKREISQLAATQEAGPTRRDAVQRGGMANYFPHSEFEEEPCYGWSEKASLTRLRRSRSVKQHKAEVAVKVLQKDSSEYWDPARIPHWSDVRRSAEEMYHEECLPRECRPCGTAAILEERVDVKKRRDLTMLQPSWHH